MRYTALSQMQTGAILGILQRNKQPIKLKVNVQPKLNGRRLHKPLLMLLVRPPLHKKPLIEPPQKLKPVLKPPELPSNKLPPNVPLKLRLRLNVPLIKLLPMLRRSKKPLRMLLKRRLMPKLKLRPMHKRLRLKLKPTLKPKRKLMQKPKQMPPLQLKRKVLHRYQPQTLKRLQPPPLLWIKLPP